MNTRQQTIVELLKQHQEVTVQDLATRFQVTTMTVRRDLEFLEQQNLLTRTHGGAVFSKPATIQFAFLERQRDRIAEKQAIARQVASQVAPGMTIVLDTGTTTLEVARAITGIPGLRVLTSSLAIASVLHAYEQIDLILLGGTVRHHSPDLAGPLTEDNLRALHTDLAILGADAVTRDGLYTSDMGIAAVSRAMIANAAETWLVADNSKFAARSFVKFAEWNAVSCVFTDDRLPDADREWLTAAVADVQTVSVKG